MASSDKLEEFLEYEVFQALWERLDTAFPEFDFRLRGHYWEARSEEGSRALPSSPRPERINAYRDAPFGFVIHGEGFVPWISYVARTEHPRGQDFVNAVESLASKAGLSMPERELSPAELKLLEERERRSRLLEAFLEFAQWSLKTHGGMKARDYLKKRGFSEEQVEKLEFGVYVGAEGVEKKLRGQGFEHNELVEAGLMAPRKGQAGYKINRWEGRVVGPWRDRGGRIINVWARDISGDPEVENKYLYIRGGSRRSPFGIDKTRGKDLVLVEGFMDALTLRANGFENVIALGGAGLGMSQVTTVAKCGVKTLTMNLDYDPSSKAGTRGTLNALDKLAGESLRVYVVPPGLMADKNQPGKKVDPDDFIRRSGREGYENLLRRAVKGTTYKAYYLLSQHDLGTDLGRDKAIEDLLAYSFKVRNEHDREDMWKMASEKTGHSLETLLDLESRKRAERDSKRFFKDMCKVLDRARHELERNGASPDVVAESLISRLEEMKAKYKDGEP